MTTPSNTERENCRKFAKFCFKVIEDFSANYHRGVLYNCIQISLMAGACNDPLFRIVAGASRFKTQNTGSKTGYPHGLRQGDGMDVLA